MKYLIALALISTSQAINKKNELVRDSITGMWEYDGFNLSETTQAPTPSPPKPAPKPIQPAPKQELVQEKSTEKDADDYRIDYAELIKNIPDRSASEYDGEYVQTSQQLKLAEYVQLIEGPDDIATSLKVDAQIPASMVQRIQE